MKKKFLKKSTLVKILIPLVIIGAAAAFVPDLIAEHQANNRTMYNKKYKSKYNVNQRKTAKNGFEANLKKWQRQFNVQKKAFMASRSPVTPSGTIQVGSFYVDNVDTTNYKPINTYSGSDKDKAYDSQCKTNTVYCRKNYWAGAQKICLARGMKLPSGSQIRETRSSGVRLSIGQYWTSDQVTSGGAWVVNGADGYGTYTSKGTKYRFRCVR